VLVNRLFDAYLAAWITGCVLAVILLLRDRRAYALSHLSYWRFLCMRWKVWTFIIAAAGLVLVAPHTGDPTWDYVDAGFMAVLTYVTAPWAVGAIYKVLRRELPLKQAYVAVCLWLFSASWSYDAYLLIRDGHPPPTWRDNLVASSVLYLLAGLLWNLEWQASRGVIFACMTRAWPSPPQGAQFRRLVWVALPIMLLVTTAILLFVVV
jgi:hypothetical protein